MPDRPWSSIIRYLRYRGYAVTFVRNFTDIDDKIIKRAQEQNTTCEELSSRFIAMFHEDMASLGVLPPTIEPKATEHVTEIIELIEDLIRKGLAYQVDTDVYFRVTGFGGYGSLSGRNLEDMQAGARISVNEKKPLGPWPTRLAHRVLGHEPQILGQLARYPRRRQGPCLSPP